MTITQFQLNLAKANSALSNTLQTMEEEILSRTYWVGSPFEFLATRGGADDTGKWGEMYLFNLIGALTYFDIQWDGDKNTKAGDGTYDLWFVYQGKKIRIEVKASRFGKKESWQHENLISIGDPCDKLIFIDFQYDTVWITIFDQKKDLFFESQHPVFGTKPTLRDNSTSKSRKDKYKWDFRILQQKRGTAAGMTYCHDITCPDWTALSEFLIDKLIN